MLLLLPELVSAARWKVPAWSEMPFALASPLPEREAKCGEGAGRRPRRREGALGLGVRKRTGSNIACCGTNSSRGQDKFVTGSLCGEMEAWLLRRHKGTTRAEVKGLA